MFRTEIVALDNGRVRVERQQLFGSTWMTINRYKADTPSYYPHRKDRTKASQFSAADEQWIVGIIKLCSQPSAELPAIEVPEVTLPSENIFQRCERLEDVVTLLVERKQRDEERIRNLHDKYAESCSDGQPDLTAEPRHV